MPKFKVHVVRTSTDHYEVTVEDAPNKAAAEAQIQGLMDDDETFEPSHHDHTEGSDSYLVVDAWEVPGMTINEKRTRELIPVCGDQPVVLTRRDLLLLIAEADEALDGDSNDAEHDALYSLRLSLAGWAEAPNRVDPEDDEDATQEQLAAIGQAALDWLTEEHDDGTRTWVPNISGADFVDAMSQAIGKTGIEPEDAE